MSTGKVTATVVGVISLVLLLRFAAALVPETQSATGNISFRSNGSEDVASDVPLRSIFLRGGVVILLVMAAIILMVVKSSRLGSKR